jgi:hypothetical protein
VLVKFVDGYFARCSSLPSSSPLIITSMLAVPRLGGVCYSFLDDNLPSRREVVQPYSYTSPAISAPCASTTRTRRPSQRCAAAASPSSSTWAAWTRSEPSPAAPLRRLPGLPGVGAPGGHTSRTAGATPPCAQAKLGAVQVRRPHGWPQLCASMRMAETVREEEDWRSLALDG